MANRSNYIKINTACLLATFLISALLFGCSGGDGGAAATQPLALSTVTHGLLKLGITGSQTDLIAGIDLLVNLPAGVSVDAAPGSGETAAGVVTLSGSATEGSNSLVVARYAAAAAGTPATLHIVVINSAGLHPGELATVRFNLARGASFPALNAFSIASVSAKGLDSSTLRGISAAPMSVAEVNASTNKQSQAILVVTGTQNFLTISVDTPTNISTQNISGTLRPGDSLTITSSTAATVSAPLINGGTWSAQVSGLVEGPNLIAVTEKDQDNVTVASVSATVILDTIPPFLNIDTVLGTKRGTSAGVAGTAEVRSTIAVQCNSVIADVIFFDDFIQNITRWSTMTLNQLHEGDNACTVTATDAAGNVTVQEVHIMIDNIPPLLDVHIDDFVKFNKIYNLYGTVESGITPAVSINGSASAGSMTVTGASWNCPVSGLNEGANIVTVSATDSAGNITSKSVTTTAISSSGSFFGAYPTIEDALKALRVAVGFDNVTYEELLRVDLYDDYKIDLADAILILRKAVGL